MEINKADVIIAGAGPAGVSAGITLARAGKKVLIVERANKAGDKNVFGGAIYTKQTEELYPEFWKNAPVERSITKQEIHLLTDKKSSSLTYNSIPPSETDDKAEAYSVIRSKWDSWCVEQAQKEGAWFAPKTLIEELIIENGKVIGIKTGREKFYADIVILADGVNSLLAKQAGLRKEFKDSYVTVNVKEVIKLPQKTIEDRFNLDENNGYAAKIFGGPLKNMFAMGFIYTNKDTLSIGVGIALDDLKKSGKRPYEILDELKAHPSIAPYIKDGEVTEYSSHMIPEGAYDNIPELYSDGVMVTGDAAGFVNNMHLEGTNLAMLSGMLAGQTAIEALNKGDFSKKTLSLYAKKLNESIIIKDLKTHNNTVSVLKKNIKTITELYPELMCEFLALLSSADGIPKQKKYRSFVYNVIKSGAVLKTVPLALFAIGKLIKK